MFRKSPSTVWRRASAAATPPRRVGGRRAVRRCRPAARLGGDSPGRRIRRSPVDGPEADGMVRLSLQSSAPPTGELGHFPQPFQRRLLGAVHAPLLMRAGQLIGQMAEGVAASEEQIDTDLFSNGNSSFHGVPPESFDQTREGPGRRAHSTPCTWYPGACPHISVVCGVARSCGRPARSAPCRPTVTARSRPRCHAGWPSSRSEDVAGNAFHRHIGGTAVASTGVPAGGHGLLELGPRENAKLYWCRRSVGFGMRVRSRFGRR
jgi:hypothetical protein